MAFDYTIHKEGHWIECRASGVLSEQDIREGFNTYLADPDFRQGMHVLIDMQDAELQVGMGTVHNFVDLLKANQHRRGINYRIALVVQPGFQETMSHLFSIYSQSQPIEVQVFNDDQPAREWVRG